MAWCIAASGVPASALFNRPPRPTCPTWSSLPDRNGAGDSTLLFELCRQRVQLTEPGRQVASLGLHRALRKTPLALVADLQQTIALLSRAH